MAQLNPRGKTVLLSGGCGFIGSHLCDALLAREDVAKLVCVDNLWTGLEANVAHIADPRFELVVSDIEAFRTAQRFDEAYHLASPASPPWYMREPARTLSANVVGAITMLGLLAEGAKFCFTSTSEVYGDPLVSPQPESYRGSVDCTGPRSSYDESKRATEALLFETRRTRGLELRVARLFNVYGPRTRPDDGRAVSNFINQALAGEPVTILGDGTQSRSWGYIDDILEGLTRFFWRDEFAYDGPLNIGNDREISVLEIARYISTQIGTGQIVHKDPLPQDPTNRCPDLTIARAILPGWECQVLYEEGVMRTAQWYREGAGRAQPAAGASS